MFEIAFLFYAVCVLLMVLVMTRKDFDGVSIIFKIIACLLGPFSLFLAWVIGYAQSGRNPND